MDLPHREAQEVPRAPAPAGSAHLRSQEESHLLQAWLSHVGRDPRRSETSRLERFRPLEPLAARGRARPPREGAPIPRERAHPRESAPSPRAAGRCPDAADACACLLPPSRSSVCLLQTLFSVVSDAQLEGEGEGSLKAPQGTPGPRRTPKPPPAGLSSLPSHLPAASRCTFMRSQCRCHPTWTG